MTKEEMLMLVKAGFTAEEIRAMSPSASAEPEPEPAPAETPEQPEAEPAEPAETEPEWKGAFEGLKQSLDSLTKQLQSENRASARIEETVNTVDDIIAGWLNPGKGN
jgi:Tfp pilus assembly protein FimV